MGLKQSSGGRSFGSGEREHLSSGTYTLRHTWVTKQWPDKDFPSLNLEIRNSENENQVEWLSSGPFWTDSMSISDDGKVLKGDVSAGSNGGAYLQMVCEATGISTDDITDLNNVDPLQMQIVMVPNPKSPKGLKKVQLVAVNPPNASAAAPTSTGDPDQNGEADDVELMDAIADEARLKAIQTLREYLGSHGILDFSNRSMAVKTLAPMTGIDDAVEQIVIANMCLESETVKAVGAVLDTKHSRIALA